MNCRDIDRALVEGRLTATGPVVGDHVSGCTGCRDLVHTLGPAVPGIQPSRTTLGHIERAIAANLRPVQPIASRRFLFGSLVTIFGCVAAVEVYRMGAFALVAMSLVQATGILGALTICTGLMALSLVQQISPGSRQWISPRMLPIGILGGLALLTASLFQSQPEQDFWVRAWVCLRAGIPIGAIAAALFWLILRRAAVLSPPMTGAAAGLLSGLVGASCLEIHCPNLDAFHILVGHLGVAVAGAGTGLIIGLVTEGRPTFSALTRPTAQSQSLPVRGLRRLNAFCPLRWRVCHRTRTPSKAYGNDRPGPASHRR